MYGYVAQQARRPAPSGGEPRLRWRLYIETSESTDSAALGTLEFRATVGGATLCVGGTAFASSEFDGARSASQAFDTSAATVWSTVGNGLPGHLGYILASASEVNEVSLVARADFGTTFGTTPKDFTIQSSDDGSSWTDEWSVSGQTGWSPGERRNFARP